MKKKWIITLLTVCCPMLYVMAQTYNGTLRDEVVRTFDLGDEEETLSIVGEKANIYLKSWDQNKVEIHLKKICRNEDETTARKEMKFMKYNLVRENKKIKIKNFIVLDPDIKKVNSYLEFEYEIMVPRHINIEIVNYFGNVSLTDISGSVKCKIKYCDLNLENVSGDMFINLNFGNINAHKMDVTGTINANKGQLAFEDVAGNYSIDMKYGKLDVRPAAAFESLVVNSNSADVNIRPTCEDYDFDIANQYGNLLVSNNRCEVSGRLEVAKPSPTLQKLTHKGKSNRSIKINAVYGEINIQYN